ncbi:AAAP amino acid permease [Mycena kentingensis (nom. inval.)]|nr:AAAP amino acid permease [Mycena kentingensis (nom. inval.)]
MADLTLPSYPMLDDDDQSWIAIGPVAPATSPVATTSDAPPTFTESRFDIILRRQRQRPPAGGGLKQPLVPSSRFLNLSSSFEFAGWGSITRLKLTAEEHATGETRLQTIRRGRVLGQWLGAALPGNAMLGSVFYALPAVVVVAGVYSPISLFIATLTPFLWRRIMQELATALPIPGAPYSYLLNVSRKSLALLGAALMLLDFTSTAVVSAATASSYITAELASQHQHSVPPAALTLSILTLFALISLLGLKESARIAAGVLSFHILTMVMLAGAAVVHLGVSRGETAVLAQNWRIGNAGQLGSAMGVSEQIFKGFCLGMLGLTGLECTASYTPYLRVPNTAAPPSPAPASSSAPSPTAPFVTFARILRNLHIPVMVLNAGMMLLVLSLVPLRDLVGEGGNSANLLSLLAERSVAGRWLRLWVVVDATVVLCGGCLSGCEICAQLFEQLAKDRIVPPMFLSTLPLTRAPHFSIFAIALLNAAFYASAGMSVVVVSKMFSLVWLTLMGIFPLALLLLRFNRGRMLLPLCSHATTRKLTRLSTIFAALVVTLVVLAGNIWVDVSTAGYFAAYLIGVLLVFGATQNQVRTLRAIYWIYDQYPALHPSRLSPTNFGQRMVSAMARLKRQPVCVLVKGDEVINLLLHMILYVRDNEETSCVKLVHFLGSSPADEEESIGGASGDDLPSELEANARILDEAFPEITIDLIIVHNAFNTITVGALAKRLEIPPSLMFMSCPGPRFQLRILRNNETVSTLQDASFRQQLKRHQADRITVDAEYVAAQAAFAAAAAKRATSDRNIELFTALTAPIRRLPEDVLLEIFEFCIVLDRTSGYQATDGGSATTYFTLDALRCPVLLTHVCAHWRSVALRTPSLWDEIIFKTRGMWSEFHALKVILARSQQRRLRVTVTSRKEHDYPEFEFASDRSEEVEVLDALVATEPSLFLDRLAHLELRCTRESLRDFVVSYQWDKAQFTTTMHRYRRVGPCFPVLTTFTMAFLGRSHSLDGAEVADFVEYFNNSPALTTLAFNTLEEIAVRPFAPNFQWSQLRSLDMSACVYYGPLVEILGACLETLEELTLGAEIWNTSTSSGPGYDIDSVPKLTLPLLHTLALSHPGSYTAVTFLTAPALRHLRLYTIEAHDFGISLDDLAKFVQRSGCTIETLAIGHCYKDGKPILNFLGHHPEIWRLEMEELCSSEHWVTFFDGFLVSEGDNVAILPKLRELVLGMALLKTIFDEGESLRKMLRSRGQARGPLLAPLEYVKIVRESVWEGHGENIIRCLGQIPLGNS